LRKGQTVCHGPQPARASHGDHVTGPVVRGVRDTRRLAIGRVVHACDRWDACGVFVRLF